MDQYLKFPIALRECESVWADELLEVVEELLKCILEKEPLSLNSVVRQLNVGQCEANTRLGQLVKAGILEKTSSPVRYQFNLAGNE